MTFRLDCQLIITYTHRIPRRATHQATLTVVAECMEKLLQQTSPNVNYLPLPQHIQSTIMGYLERPIPDGAVTRSRDWHRKSCNWTDPHENFYDSTWDYITFAIDEEMAIIRNTHGLARQHQLMRLIDVKDWTRTIAKKWRRKAFRDAMIYAFTAHLPKDMRKPASGMAGKLIDKVCKSGGI